MRGIFSPRTLDLDTSSNLLSLSINTSSAIIQDTRILKVFCYSLILSSPRGAFAPKKAGGGGALTFTREEFAFCVPTSVNFVRTTHNFGKGFLISPTGLFS